ncbi:metal ABC transporter ATP-binding protein [Baaleninema simplex]|uniref:metal ABC transporter ATP-binding protein n=1 Tax=Baaleninema simplex TaxID=2862350 RepID=UPI0003473531|nr:metal ABC transporter ATP-binding protein [Baaleninema simplex]
MSESSPAILVRHLWAGYDRDPVLEDINLSVEAGDFIGIIGPNGGGKTTFLKVLLGSIAPMRGRVEIFGRPVKQGRRFIGYVPQGIDFDREFPVRVRDVVRMGRLGKRRLLKRYNAKDDDIVDHALEQLEMLDFVRTPIGELSGGQRQRVYIARALASEPRVLLLDEPTASIDPKMQTNVYELLRQLNETIPIVLVSHDLGAVSTYVKTIGCLNRRLFYHGEKQISAEMLEKTYQCPVDLIAHGVPHRVFPEHHDRHDCQNPDKT